MDLPHLRTFLAVAHDRSFSRAAEKLFISQPAVSKQIQALEEMLGMRVFDRVGRSVILTEAGHILQSHAHIAFQSLEEARETISQLRGLQKGHLPVSAASTIGTYMLPKPLGAFKAKHPGIEISLAITNKARVVEQLLNHEVELGFVGPPVEPGELEKEEYLLDELVLIVGPTHRLAREETVAVRDLTEEVFILREQGSGTREIMEEELGRLRVSLKKAMELGSTEAVKQAVAANLGISIVSKFAITLETLQGRLTAVRLPELNLRRQLFIIYHKARTLSPAAQEFCQLLKETSGGERETLSPRHTKIRSRRGRSASVSSTISR